MINVKFTQSDGKTYDIQGEKALCVVKEGRKAHTIVGGAVDVKDLLEIFDVLVSAKETEDDENARRCFALAMLQAIVENLAREHLGITPRENSPEEEKQLFLQCTEDILNAIGEALKKTVPKEEEKNHACH